MVGYWEVFYSECLVQVIKSKKKIMNKIEKWIRSGTATVIDVRTHAEFMGGHVAGSINIPLQNLAQQVEEIRKKENIILCCASGNRSGQAAIFLKQQRIACENGGSWMEVNALCK
jgi:rhodanese-related sulfurtransferase